MKNKKLFESYAKPRSCEPGGSFKHTRGCVHWQVCDVHKKRWRWGQNVLSIGWSMMLDPEQEQRFFSEYEEGHCPGYEEYGDFPGASKLVQ